MPAAPAVDFSSKLVIVAAMGGRPTGGYSIDVEDVSLTGENASITILETSPGSGCIVTEALTAPVVAVVVPRFTGHGSFVEHTTQRNCR